MKIPFKLPIYEIRFTRVPPAMDGWIESPAWHDAVWVDRFISVETERETHQPTSSAMLWDRRYLYAAFRCQDERLALLKSDAQSPDQVGNDDCVEIYLDPGIPDIEAFVIAVNPAGAIGLARRVIDNPGWGTLRFMPLNGTHAAARLTFHGWQFELAIPFEALDLPAPEAGDVWRGNLCRNDKLGFQWSYWALEKKPRYAYDSKPLYPHLRFSRQSVPVRRPTSRRAIAPNRPWPSCPRFDLRGMMYDTSRGAIVLTADYWEKMLPLLAAQGLNTVLMYFENHLTYPSHPEFAPPGSWTLKDLVRLQHAASKLGIDVIPSQTSLGHCPGILNHPKYTHLAEKGSGGYQLCVAHTETASLLENVFSELCQASLSPYVNINADESAYLGLCPRCRRTFPGWSRGRIFRHHILRLYDVLKSYGKRMMMWDDMLWTFPDATEDLPRDIILLDWHYALHRKYPSVDVWRAMGFDVVVCPGMYRVQNAFWFADYGAARGALGLINTLWESHSLPLGHYWPHLAATSWAAHSPAPPDDQIGAWYEQAAERFFGVERLGRALACTNQLSRRGHKPPWISSIDVVAARQVAEEARHASDAYEGHGPTRTIMKEFAYSARLMRLQTETSWQVENKCLNRPFRKWARTELESLTQEGTALWTTFTSCKSQKPFFFERHAAIKRLLSQAQ